MGTETMWCKSTGEPEFIELLAMQYELSGNVRVLPHMLRVVTCVTNCHAHSNCPSPSFTNY